MTPITQTQTTALVGDTFPQAMTPADMCRAFGISYPTFRRMELAGKFRAFQLPRPIGLRRYAGAKVAAFLADGRK